MNCVCCGSAAVTGRPEVTARGYRRFRCRTCGRQFNERSAGALNRTCLPSDIIALVVFCRLRYRLTLRDLSEIMALRGIEASHEAVRDWEAKLLPVMGNALRKRRRGMRRGSGASWYVDETYLKVRGRWTYLYRAIDRDGKLIDAMLSEHRDLKAEGVLPLGQGDHGLSAGPGDDGRPWLLPKGDPQCTGQDRPAPDQCLPEQPSRAGSSRHQGQDPMFARLQEP